MKNKFIYLIQYILVVGIIFASISNITTASVLFPSDLKVSAFDVEISSFGNPKVKRIGATCCDGSSSGATGRGACSHHGGVKYWEMSNGKHKRTGRCR